MVIETFEDDGALNQLGGLRMVFSNPGKRNCTADLTKLRTSEVGADDEGYLAIQYDVTRPGVLRWVVDIAGGHKPDGIYRCIFRNPL